MAAHCSPTGSNRNVLGHAAVYVFEHSTDKTSGRNSKAFENSRELTAELPPPRSIHQQVLIGDSLVRHALRSTFVSVDSEQSSLTAALPHIL